MPGCCEGTAAGGSRKPSRFPNSALVLPALLLLLELLRSANAGLAQPLLLQLLGVVCVLLLSEKAAGRPEHEAGVTGVRAGEAEEALLMQLSAVTSLLTGRNAGEALSAATWTHAAQVQGALGQPAAIHKYLLLSIN